jgi:hypothetical protein
VWVNAQKLVNSQEKKDLVAECLSQIELVMNMQMLCGWMNDWLDE